MRRRRRSGPLVQNRDGTWSLVLDENEREVLAVSVTQLRGLLQSGADADRTRRLFPVAYSADDAADAEWQRLMRDELVQSRVAALDRVDTMLTGDRAFTDAELTSLMITVNALRLVLGTLLDVTDDPEDGRHDPDEGPDPADEAATAQWHLYMWLGWLLEWIVEAQDPEPDGPVPSD